MKLHKAQILTIKFSTKLINALIFAFDSYFSYLNYLK